MLEDALRLEFELFGQYLITRQVGDDFGALLFNRQARRVLLDKLQHEAEAVLELIGDLLRSLLLTREYAQDLESVGNDFHLIDVRATDSLLVPHQVEHADDGLHV